MAEPAEKSPAVANMLDGLFGRTAAIKGDTCTLCKRPATAFTDAISKREYALSGLCQKCQDVVFAPEEDD